MSEIKAIIQTPISHRQYLARKYYVGFNFEVAIGTGTPLLTKSSSLSQYAATEYQPMGRRSISWSASDIQVSATGVLTAKPVIWYNNSGGDWTFRQVFLQRLDNQLVFQLITFPNNIIIPANEEFRLVIGGNF